MTAIAVSCRLNGRPVRLELAPNELLIDVLRDRLGCRSVKRACDTQVCGACTVLLDGAPYSACSTLALELRGRDVLTLEGLAAGGELHPLQQAFIDLAALQCGFCTPGMILSAHALLQTCPTPDRERIVHWLHGNVCRCTGYASVVAAVEQVAGGREEQ